jgi:hypothetical protein
MATTATKGLPLNYIVKRRQVFFHPVRSLNFMNALLRDSRIHVAKKVMFVLATMALIVMLVFPGLLEETFLSAILPVLGTILGIPLDVGLNWLSFALVSVHLFRLFPAEIVSEHYNAHILLQKDVALIEADSK